jgi:hypothetical protein
MPETAVPSADEERRRDELSAGATALLVLLTAAILATTSTVSFGFNYSMSQVHWSTTTWAVLGLFRSFRTSA